jgi:hypothetical protein
MYQGRGKKKEFLFTDTDQGGEYPKVRIRVSTNPNIIYNTGVGDMHRGILSLLFVDSNQDRGKYLFTSFTVEKNVD